MVTERTALAFVRIDPASRRGEILGDAGDERGLGTPRRITSTTTANAGRGCKGGYMAPVWSPDSVRLAFTCGWGPNTSLLYRVRADGTGQVSILRLSDAADSTPTWSPDSAPLVFARHNRSVNGQPRTSQPLEGGGRPGAVPSSYGAASTEPAVSSSGELVYVERDERTLTSSLRASTLTPAPRRRRTSEARSMAFFARPPDEELVFTVGDGLTRSAIRTVHLPTGTSTTASSAATVAFGADVALGDRGSLRRRHRHTGRQPAGRPGHRVESVPWNLRIAGGYTLRRLLAPVVR